MVTKHNLRFFAKALIAAISIAGIFSAYRYITGNSEYAREGVKIIAIDDMPTASISHFPEERFELEALAGVKTERKSDRKVQSKSTDKFLPNKRPIMNKPKIIHAETVASQSREMTNGHEAKIGMLRLEKKSFAETDKESLMKIDPIAVLLSKY